MATASGTSGNTTARPVTFWDGNNLHLKLNSSNALVDGYMFEPNEYGHQSIAASTHHHHLNLMTERHMYVVTLGRTWTIRAMLVAIAVLSIPCAWLRVQMVRYQSEQAVVNRAEWIRDGANQAWCGPGWFGVLFGKWRCFDRVVHLSFGGQVTDDDLKQLRCFTELKSVTIIAASRFTGAGLIYLTDLPVTELVIGATELSDDGLASLGRLKSLECLYIGNVRQTDLMVKAIQTLPSLRLVGVLNGISLEMEQLRTIARIQKLEVLELNAGSIKALGGRKRLDAITLIRPNIDVRIHPEPAAKDQ